MTKIWTEAEAAKYTHPDYVLEHFTLHTQKALAEQVILLRQKLAEMEAVARKLEQESNGARKGAG